jgi:hypothetical protein
MYINCGTWSQYGVHLIVDRIVFMTNLTDEAPFKLLTFERTVDVSKVQLHWFSESGDVIVSQVTSNFMTYVSQFKKYRVTFGFAKFCIDSV